MIVVVWLCLGGELIGDPRTATGHLCSVTADWQMPPSIWPVSTVLETHGGPGDEGPWNGGHLLPYGGH